MLLFQSLLEGETISGRQKIRPDKRSVVIRSPPVEEIGSSLLDYGQRRSIRPGDLQRRGLAGFETRGRRPGSGVPAFPFSCVLHMVRSGRRVWTNGSRLLSRWMCGRVLRQHVHTSSHPSPQEAGGRLTQEIPHADSGSFPYQSSPRGLADHQPLRDSRGNVRLDRKGGIALRVHARCSGLCVTVLQRAEEARTGFWGPRKLDASGARPLKLFSESRGHVNSQRSVSRRSTPESSLRFASSQRRPARGSG